MKKVTLNPRPMSQKDIWGSTLGRGISSCKGYEVEPRLQCSRNSKGTSATGTGQAGERRGSEKRRGPCRPTEVCDFYSEKIRGFKQEWQLIFKRIILDATWRQNVRAVRVKSSEIWEELDATIQELDNGSLSQNSSRRENMNQFQDIP